MHQLTAGGDQERDEACDEAVAAIFEKGVACHRHMRCYTSRRTGKRKWTVLEMWPIADPLDGQLAVMVSEYNMTQQKELELQLSAQHLSLQRSAVCKLCLPYYQLAQKKKANTTLPGLINEKLMSISSPPLLAGMYMHTDQEDDGNKVGCRRVRNCKVGSVWVGFCF